MNGWENETYRTALLISNAVALLVLLLAWLRPAWARWCFIVLFAWACYSNTAEILRDADSYLTFAELTFLPLYRDIILGPFAAHIPVYVGLIATCQGLIAIGLLTGGRLARIAGWGAIVFLLAILPLGVGAGFPCTLVFALAMFMLLRKGMPRAAWSGRPKA